MILWVSLNFCSWGNRTINAVASKDQVWHKAKLVAFQSVHGDAHGYLQAGVALRDRCAAWGVAIWSEVVSDALIE